MLLVHETHELDGRRHHEFEDLYRAEAMPGLAKEGGARLLWYCSHAQGSGPSYHVITMTAVADGAAWDRYIERTTAGDLADLWCRLDACRYRCTTKTLLPVYWSPLQEVDLDSVPTDGAEHELSLYMEDTGWPTASLDDYIAYWDTDYYRYMKEIPADRQLLDIQACFQTAFGTGHRPEAILMQKIMSLDALKGLYSRTEKYPDTSTWPGSYMIGALALRDQWESRLLRTTNWSPRY